MDHHNNIDVNFRRLIQLWGARYIYYAVPTVHGSLGDLLTEEIAIDGFQVWIQDGLMCMNDTGETSRKFLGENGIFAIIKRAIYKVALKLLKDGASLKGWPECDLGTEIRTTYLVILAMCHRSQTELAIDIIRVLKGYLV